MVWTIIPARMLARFNGFFVHLVMSQRLSPVVFHSFCGSAKLQDQQKGRVCSFGLPVIYIVELHKKQKDGVLITVEQHSSQCIYSTLYAVLARFKSKQIHQPGSLRGSKECPQGSGLRGVPSGWIDWMMSGHGFV